MRKRELKEEMKWAHRNGGWESGNQPSVRKEKMFFGVVFCAVFAGMVSIVYTVLELLKSQ